jgi:sugar/nucleoside kinase (ribokinase family)
MTQHDLGAITAGITLGGARAYVEGPGGAVHDSAYGVEVVDPSGGDAFDVGYIVGLLEGRKLARTVTFASAAGTLACTALGCTAGLCARRVVEAFIAAQTPVIGG